MNGIYRYANKLYTAIKITSWYRNYSNFFDYKKHPFWVNFTKVTKNKITTEADTKIHKKNVVQLVNH